MSSHDLSEEIRIAAWPDPSTELLEEFTRLAFNWDPAVRQYTRDELIRDDLARRYWSAWGREHDTAVAARRNADPGPVGAAWYRLYTSDAPGYGYIDDATPEISIAVRDGYRGMRLGTALLDALIENAQRARFAALTLSVERENPAVRLYEKAGFVVAFEAHDAFVMRIVL